MLHSYVYQPNRRKQNKHDGKYAKGAVLFFLCGFLSIGALILKTKPNSEQNPQPEIAAAQSTPSAIPTSHPKKPTPKPARSHDELIRNITEVIETYGGTYSIRFEDLKTKDSFSINDELVMDAASLSKVQILTALYDQVDQGKIDLNQVITIPPKDVQHYGTGSIQYEKQPIRHTIQELAEFMIKQSDNTAAYVLAHTVMNIEQIQEIVEKFGLSQTNMEKNATTNRDMAKLFRKLFESRLADKVLTEEMIQMMKDSTIEDRLPAQLPDDATVFHKIGTQVHKIHDVGVIQTGDKLYYLGIMTEEVPNENAAIESLGIISKIVYDYMTAH